MLDSAAASLAEVAEHTTRLVQWSVSLDGLTEPVFAERKVRQLAARHRLSVVVTHTGVNGKPAGPGPARNAALAGCRSRWLLTLDSDDRLVADGVGAMLAAVAATPGAAWAAGRCPHTDSAFEITWAGPEDPFPPGPVLPGSSFWEYKLTTGDLPFLCTATVASTAAIRTVGGWPKNHRARAEDTALWAVLTSRYVGVWVPKDVYLYRRHSASVTKQPGFRQFDEGLNEIATMVATGSTDIDG